MPKPDGAKEDLGIVVLDEPALNHEDKTVLELKYVQSKNVVRAAPMDIDSIENADKKTKGNFSLDQFSLGFTQEQTPSNCQLHQEHA